MIEARLWSLLPSVLMAQDCMLSCDLGQPGTAFLDLYQEATSFMTDFSFHPLWLVAYRVPLC